MVSATTDEPFSALPRRFWPAVREERVWLAVTELKRASGELQAVGCKVTQSDRVRRGEGEEEAVSLILNFFTSFLSLTRI